MPFEQMYNCLLKPQLRLVELVFSSTDYLRIRGFTKLTNTLPENDCFQTFSIRARDLFLTSPFCRSSQVLYGTTIGILTEPTSLLPTNFAHALWKECYRFILEWDT
jgi:hypothetical protein